VGNGPEPTLVVYAFQDPQRGDAVGPMPSRRRHRLASRVRRRDERIGPVVDVEQRALQALQQDDLTLVECDVEQPPGVGDRCLKPSAVDSRLSNTSSGASALRL
jgi:hypothetical protein